MQKQNLIDWLLDELMKVVNNPDAEHNELLQDLVDEEKDELDPGDQPFWSDPNLMPEFYKRSNWQYLNSTNYDKYNGSCVIHRFTNVKYDGCILAEVETDLGNTRVKTITIENQ